MKNGKNLKLKLTIDTEDLDEDDTESNENSQIANTKKLNYNRGKKRSDLSSSKDVDELKLIKSYLTTSNIEHDYSFHWFEKCSNLSLISESIKININDTNFTEPTRDYECEFQLLKLITEDSYHKENLISLPKSLKRLNRYSDILPCKIHLFR